ncbi:MAG: hypothetical protein CFE24_14920 [Flavobacterium sp. BFFFF2]|nr:MAG: hypothetical protein CFE24_14920 [Flavobacterium sp. BFFFF2]
MTKRKIYQVIEVSQKMIKTFPKQGHNRVVFNATFFRNGKKLNSIDEAMVSNFSPLVRNYEKSENPDKVKIEFKDLDKNSLIWSKTFLWNESEDSTNTSSNFSGLGEAEVNELVQRKFAEMEKNKDLKFMSSEIDRLKSLNEDLAFQVQDMEASLDAKKQIEYYTNIIGMALPGLAKFFTGSPVANAINFLAGTEEQPKTIEQNNIKENSPEQRETILEMISGFCQTMSNQELGTMYLLLSEIEKDRNSLKRILEFITQQSLVQTENQ